MRNGLLFAMLFLATISGCVKKEVQAIKKSGVKTTVVNLNTDVYDVYIGRGTTQRTNMLTEGIQPGEEGWLGNPHPIGYCDICAESHTREECIERFKADFDNKSNNDSYFRDAVLALKGKRLGCYCKPKACHGGVIKDWIESQ